MPTTDTDLGPDEPLKYPELPAPKAHTRKPRRPSIRLWKTGTARTALADFGPSLQTTVYTFGQFSLIDAVEVMLERTGPADIDICVWTAGTADLQRMQYIAKKHHVGRTRWIIDQSFDTRHAPRLALLRSIAGDENIRTIRGHAKFITIGNDDWNIVMRSSMNLNQNIRFEHLDVDDDPDYYAWHTDLVDGIFDLIEPGDYGRRTAAEIVGVEAETMPAMTAMGIARTGVAHTGRFAT